MTRQVSSGPRRRATRPPRVPGGGPPPAGAPRQARASYEAGAHTRRTLGWHAPTTSPNTALLGTLTTLRDRARTATRNNGYAWGAIERWVTNLVGTGIKPLSQAPDDAFRRAIHQRWLRWTDESDADGLLDWYGQQTQAARTWTEAGEAFIRLRPRRPEDGLSVPLQVQILEPELCPHVHQRPLETGVIRAGIEFNRIGRRVAYWFARTRPESDLPTGEYVRVPADRVIHLYDPVRPGQLRGVPGLVQALIRLHELDKMDDATLLRQQIANLFAGFITRTPGETGALHPLTGQAIGTTGAGDRPVLTLEPGILQELAAGEDVTFADPPAVSPAYGDFVRQQLYHIAAATGIPYETLTGDLSRVNDRTVRVILHEFRRRVQAKQHQILAFQLCRRVWRAWLEAGFLSGTLPLPAAYAADPEPWAAAQWMPQRWPYLHPVQDVQAEQRAIRAGFTSRSATVSEHGEDAEEIDRQQALDNARADGLGLRYDSDARQAERPGTGAVDPTDDDRPDAPSNEP